MAAVLILCCAMRQRRIGIILKIYIVNLSRRKIAPKKIAGDMLKINDAKRNCGSQYALVPNSLVRVLLRR